MGEACNAGAITGRLKRRTSFDQLVKGRLLAGSVKSPRSRLANCKEGGVHESNPHGRGMKRNADIGFFMEPSAFDYANRP